MGSDQAGRLLIYSHDDTWVDKSIPAPDLIRLTASMQRKFPKQVVEPADLELLRRVVRDSLPLPAPVVTPGQMLDELVGSYDPKDPDLDLAAPGDGAVLEVLRHEYVYVVLAWLAGVVSKEAAEHAVGAVADLVREWMRERRNEDAGLRQVAFILGPDGEVLKRVEVRPKTRGSSKRRRRSS